MIEVYSFDDLKKYPNLLHAVSTKSKSYPYNFSLALHTGENKQCVVENRERIAGYLGLKNDWHFVVADQIHSDHIKIITKTDTKGWKNLDDAIEDCDALITDLKNVMLTILTADCVPVLLFDPKRKIVAAVHAGWKGTKSKIVAKTVLRMQEVFGSDPKDIVAAVAPSIGRCCYEVGEDVARHFFDIPKGYTKKGDKYMLDLPYINKYQLLDSGLLDAHIAMSNVCTACEVEHYFSYRKEKGCSGRFMSMIGMNR